MVEFGLFSGQGAERIMWDQRSGELRALESAVSEVEDEGGTALEKCGELNAVGRNGWYGDHGDSPMSQDVPGI